MGDSLTSDMQGGMNIGIKTCWFNPERIEASDKVRIDYEITALKELKDILFSK